LIGHYYILVDKEPVPVDDVLEWARMFEGDRHVGNTTIKDVVVSTVFLGIDHNFRPDGPPLLFETMVFGGEHDQYQDRYSTWEEAERGHAEICKMVQDSLELEGVLESQLKEKGNGQRTLRRRLLL
jgi:hypothetical protein